MRAMTPDELKGPKDDGLFAVERLARQRLALEVAKSATGGQLGEVMQIYRREQTAITQDRRDLEFGQRFFELGFAVAGDLPLPKMLPVGTLGTLTQWEMEDALKRIDAQKDHLNGKVLAGAFQQFRDAHADDFAKLAAMSPAEREAALDPNSPIGGLFAASPMFDGLDTAGKAELANARGTVLFDAFKAASEGLAQTNDELAAQKTEFQRFQKEVAAFKATTASRLDALSEGQKALTEAVGLLVPVVQKSIFRLDAVEGILWSKMTAKEKVAALKSGAFGSVVATMPDKETYLAKLRKAEIMETASDTIAVTKAMAADFAAIGKAVGVDLEAPAQSVIQAADVAQSLLLIASGEPISVISGLGSLSRMFGGSRPDPNAEALAAIQREMSTMRREMFEQHKAVMETLGRMSDQIDRNFRYTTAQNNLVFSQVSLNTAQLDELLTDNLRDCKDLATDWRPQAVGETYEARAQRINATALSELANCRSGIKHRFPKAGGGKLPLSNVFLLQPPDKQPTQAQLTALNEFKTKVYTPTIAYTLNRMAKEVPKHCQADQLIYLSLLPAGVRPGHARSRLSALAASCTANVKYEAYAGGASPTDVDVAPLLLQPVSATGLLELGPDLLTAAELYEFQTTSGLNPRMRTPAQVKKAALQVDAPVELLRRILGPVNLAVAQQNALAGDLILDALIADVETGLEKPENRNATAFSGEPGASVCAVRATVDATPEKAASIAYGNAICVLAANPIVLRNFATHWVRSRLARPNSVFVSYAVGLIQSRPELLTYAFNQPMPLLRPADTWVFELPGARDLRPTLPSWEEVAANRQAQPLGDTADPQPNFYPRLVGLREALETRIAEYETSRHLTADQRDTLYASAIVTTEQGVSP